MNVYLTFFFYKITIRIGVLLFPKKCKVNTFFVSFGSKKWLFFQPLIDQYQKIENT